MAKVIDKQSIGERIKFFRIRKEMSQLELEVEAELSTGSISKMESGKVLPNQKSLHRIAVALDLEPKEIAYLFEINLYV